MGGGIETFLILTGTVELRVAGRSPVSLSGGQGAYIPPGTPLQLFNRGSTPVKLIAFLVGPAGQPYRTSVDAPL